MNSREKILAAVAANSFNGEDLPDIQQFEKNSDGSAENYAAVLSAIGGNVFFIQDLAEVDRIIESRFAQLQRVVNLVPGIHIRNQETGVGDIDANTLHNVDLAVVKGRFAVAENGAVWITEDDFAPRALPFICEHLAVVIESGSIVPTMHEAYQKLALTANYGYSCFIAGPSKTADIEQSLVIGAHGPRSMSVFIKM